MASSFKMNVGLKLETAKATKAAMAVNMKHKKPNKGIIFGLKTLDKYYEQDDEIRKLLIDYQLLVAKDMLDVDKMIDEALAADREQKKKYIIEKIKGLAHILTSGAGTGSTAGGGGGGGRF